MFDQKTVTYVTARLLGATAMWPDGVEWPEPFAAAPAWLREAAANAQPEFLEALRRLAHRIADAGAQLDPEDLGGWLVLAQLALLGVDLTRDPAELVSELNTWPPGWIDREAATLGHVATHVSRHGRNARFEADLAAMGETIAARLGPPSIRPPYAEGQKRAAPSETERLRRALIQLVEQDPSLTPGQLLHAVAKAEHPALEALRAALGWQSDYVPDQRLLERNWPKSRH